MIVGCLHLTCTIAESAQSGVLGLGVSAITGLYPAAGMIFRKEPFFYGHDNYDQLVKIAKARAPHPPLARAVLQS